MIRDPVHRYWYYVRPGVYNTLSRKNPNSLPSAFLAGGLLILSILGCTPPRESTQKPEEANRNSPSPQRPLWDKSPTAQAKRLKFINQGIRLGVIKRIE